MRNYYQDEWVRQAVEMLSAALEKLGWHCMPSRMNQDDIMRCLLDRRQPASQVQIYCWREVGDRPRGVALRLEKCDLREYLDNPRAEYVTHLHGRLLAYCRLINFDIACPCGAVVPVPRHEEASRPPTVVCPACGYQVSMFYQRRDA